MSSKCGNKSLKHKLSESLLLVNNSKKKRLSSNSDEGASPSKSGDSEAITELALSGKSSNNLNLSSSSDSDSEPSFKEINALTKPFLPITRDTNQNLSTNLAKSDGSPGETSTDSGVLSDPIAIQRSSKLKLSVSCKQNLLDANAVKINSNPVVDVVEPSSPVTGRRAKKTPLVSARISKKAATQPVAGNSKKMKLESTQASTKSNKKNIGKTTAKPTKIKSPSSKILKKKIVSKIPEPTEVKPDTDCMDVSQLLALGEGQLEEPIQTASASDSSDSENDWEEVANASQQPELKEPVIPQEGVDITVEAPLASWKRKKKGVDIEGEIRRQLNRRQREIQELMHKVHLLCCISRLKQLNRILNSENLLAISISSVNKNMYPPKRADTEYLERILKWFKKSFSFNKDGKSNFSLVDLEERLCCEMMEKKAESRQSFVYMFVILLRSLGLQARLVESLVTVPLKPSTSRKVGNPVAVGAKIKPEVEAKPSKAIVPKNPVAKAKIITKTEMKVESTSSTEEAKKPSKVVKQVTTNKDVKARSRSTKITSKAVDKPKEPPARRSVRTRVVKTVVDESSSDEEEFSKHFKTPTKSSPKVTAGDSLAKIKQEQEELKNEIKMIERQIGIKDTVLKGLKGGVSPKVEAVSSVLSDGKKELVVNKRKSSGAGSAKESVQKVTSKTAASKKIALKREGENLSPMPGGSKIKKEDESDDDFSPTRPTSASKKKLDRRVFSSDDDDKTVAVTKKIGQDVWTEVFLEAIEKWITVDVMHDKIHCVQQLYLRATHPVVYVLAVNNDSTLKDVTKRYVPHWHSDTRKRRVAEQWWHRSLWPYLPPSSAREKEEDEDIAKQLEDMPLPTSISEYKMHPLYALKRHILKFEGIYPPDAPPLGFIKKEPVYARECVVTLRSRDIWFKEARVVRLREEPYKIVKSRPKYDKMTGEWRKDLPLELFGVWQTEDYIPPIAVNGKVPRNEYGNVDLFKPCMLPGGTVHLQIPGLIRVAKKLDIDCAPAVTGFEFHAGGSHPVHDGFVVCEEFKQVLLDAWDKDAEESEKRALEKLEKRVYGNWRRLIRGLLIRENLKLKYAFGENEDNDETPSSSTSKPAKPLARRFSTIETKSEEETSDKLAKLVKSAGRRVSKAEGDVTSNAEEDIEKPCSSSQRPKRAGGRPAKAK